MERGEWDSYFDLLKRSRDVVAAWTPTGPDPAAARCEQSRHRTLAHLRACQGQWLAIVTEFLARDKPSVTVLHPWRQFDRGLYAELAWDEHLTAFLKGREEWLRLQNTADWTRGGKWNRKPDTVGGLTKRLANHEDYHLGLKGIL